MIELECARCGEVFPFDQQHTELVRRDYEGKPKPKKVEHLCPECLEAYREFVEQSAPN